MGNECKCVAPCINQPQIQITSDPEREKELTECQIRSETFQISGSETFNIWDEYSQSIHLSQIVFPTVNKHGQIIHIPYEQTLTAKTLHEDQLNNAIISIHSIQNSRSQQDYEDEDIFSENCAKAQINVINQQIRLSLQDKKKSLSTRDHSLNSGHDQQYSNNYINQDEVQALQPENKHTQDFI